MKLVEARSQERLDKIQNLYNEAFPSLERKPFALLLKTLLYRYISRFKRR